jgi:hypothetical protein
VIDVKLEAPGVAVRLVTEATFAWTVVKLKIQRNGGSRAGREAEWESRLEAGDDVWERGQVRPTELPVVDSRELTQMGRIG